ncbi:predicted protein [Postia placenta Mad-698-R]|nr:predicted protein [Postia placenta Mad-698-R]
MAPRRRSRTSSLKIDMSFSVGDATPHEKRYAKTAEHQPSHSDSVRSKPPSSPLGVTTEAEHWTEQEGRRGKSTLSSGQDQARYDVIAINQGSQYDIGIAYSSGVMEVHGGPAVAEHPQQGPGLALIRDTALGSIRSYPTLHEADPERSINTIANCLC